MSTEGCSVGMKWWRTITVIALKGNFDFFFWPYQALIISKYPLDFKSSKTLSMVLLFCIAHISTPCEPHHVT